MKHFKSSIFFAVAGLALAFGSEYYLSQNFQIASKAIFLALVLAVLEVSLSFDNAVVNAFVLKKMTNLWRERFLTWGILIAVFGMRFLLPLIIVAVVGRMGIFEAFNMAIKSPADYAKLMESAHHSVSAFGGIFLLMVALKYFIDDEKVQHWIRWVEVPLKKLSKLESIEVALTLALLLALVPWVDTPHQVGYLMAGIAGLIVYLLVDALGALLSDWGKSSQDMQRASLGMFLYLEVLDASFSFDGVIGAFAITKQLPLIMIGLGIGAIFVRSLTIYFVKERVLDGLRFLEHGAFYAIGSLSVLMLFQIFIDIPEWITGLSSALIIGLAIFHSWIDARRLRSLRGVSSGMDS